MDPAAMLKDKVLMNAISRFESRPEIIVAGKSAPCGTFLFYVFRRSVTSISMYIGSNSVSEVAG
jgi:hypothetical protein